MDVSKQSELCLCKTSPSRSSASITNRSSGRWTIAFFGLACVASLLLSAYVINDLCAYKLRVQTLESSVAGFQSQLVDLNLALAKPVEGKLSQPNHPREKREVNDLLNQPRRLFRGLQRRATRAPAATRRRNRFTTVLPTVAGSRFNVSSATRRPSGYLPNTAEQTPSLKVGRSGGTSPSRPGPSQRQSYAGTFTRWGKVSCPQSTTTVYSGYAASAHPADNMGGASELECLPIYPSWQSNSVTNTQANTKLYPAKFSLEPHSGIFQSSAENAVITCAVCITKRAPTIVIPGRVNCPFSWYKEYSGYLMSSIATRHPSMLTSKNYCVDRNPDYYTGFNDDKGLKLTFVQAGSCHQNQYPCLQYRENYRIGCTVCTRI